MLCLSAQALGSKRKWSDQEIAAVESKLGRYLELFLDVFIDHLHADSGQATNASNSHIESILPTIVHI